MDLQCPMAIICLAPGDEVPSSVAGHRLVAAYAYDLAPRHVTSPVPIMPAPEGSFWEVLPKIADQHRGEAVALFAAADDLQRMDLRGIALSVDSRGPVRIATPDTCG